MNSGIDLIWFWTSTKRKSNQENILNNEDFSLGNKIQADPVLQEHSRSVFNFLQICRNKYKCLK